MIKTRIRQALTVLVILQLIVLSSCKEDFHTWKTLNAEWLENNKKKSGVEVISSGLQIERHFTPPHTAKQPKTSSYVKIIYKGYYAVNGVVFDEVTEGTWQQVSNFVSGFQEALISMTEGASCTVYIPHDLAYGSTGSQSSTDGSYYIPPYSTLVFEIQLLEVENF